MQLRNCVSKSFGTIRNNTALKQPCPEAFKFDCFGTIRNNTALKRTTKPTSGWTSFGTIRNNTALKLIMLAIPTLLGFGTIRNNTALKLLWYTIYVVLSFGTIRNNTALKPRGPFFLTKFRNRAICLSLTSAPNNSILNYFIPQTKGQFRVLLILVNLNRERC